MKRSPEAIEVIPSASRLVSSLRDLGYDFAQAVADLVDNSITAEATRISIDLRFEGPDSWLRIADDGHGMTGAEITEAMRYGSQQVYDEEDLGRFGLGLKTASLSQCRRLSVASRAGPSRARIQVRVLDLDHVVDSDRWEILALKFRNADERLVELLRDRPGTVVMWESLDRVLGYKIQWGKRAHAALAFMAGQLDLHLGMIFHRFLAGEIHGRQKVQIFINGRRVRPWDPFARDEEATEVLPESEVDVRIPGGIGLVRFQPFVLPPREKFSSEEAFHRLAGPRKWNAQQGFYIYRSNRMIQSGGWCRMRAQDEHLKLARAAIDFYPELDSAFEINVAKVRAVLPADLRERLQIPVETMVRAAQAVYREHAPQSEADSKGDSRRSRRANGFAVIARPAMEKAAQRTGQLRALRRIVGELRSTDPEVARGLGW